jgi:hypothetical protein
MVPGEPRKDHSMDRRQLLAAIGATAFSVAALTAAVAATTQVFATGNSPAGVGTISPVSTTAVPQAVAPRVLEVGDPAPVGVGNPVPTPRPTTGADASPTPAVSTPAGDAAVVPTSAAPTSSHDHVEYEPGDD